jgi:DNA-3-methyladenine glycosylase
LRLPVVEAARALLGCVLLSTIGGARTAGVIVETEAYGGPDDPASHASTARGPTRRNRVMFGPPGRAYVYRSYGMHWCMNVVTGSEGTAQAVLIRGLEPIEGEAAMALRRSGAAPLAAGPGRLCAALAITDGLYGHDLREPPLQLLRGWSVPSTSIEVSARIGIAAARDWPHRFFVRGSTGVSRPGSRRVRAG